MAFEIEIKAHLDDSQVEDVRSIISGLDGCKSYGSIDKYDVYWSSSEDGDPMFRTRREVTDSGSCVLFTAKPSKTKSLTGTESNEEIEYSSNLDQWDDVQYFVSRLGYKICRRKWKKGYHFGINRDGFDVHVEILNVKYLGWFLEMEICPKTLDGFDTPRADKALRSILADANVSEDKIESLGYNRMLRMIGKERG